MELVETRTERLQERVRLGEVLARCAFAFVQIRDRIEAESVDAEVHPELEDFEERVVDRGIVEVQIRLMRIEAMQEIGFWDRIPCLVGDFEYLQIYCGVLFLFR